MKPGSRTQRIRDGVRRDPKDLVEKAGPDDLIDEARRPGEEEEQIEATHKNPVLVDSKAVGALGRNNTSAAPGGGVTLET